MPLYPNLISDSLLINDTVAMLRMFGGRASAVKIVDHVMNIRRAEPAIARTLIQDLVERDPRLKLIEDTVELVQNVIDAQRLLETDFVVFDLETTGAKAPPCRIIEVGAYRIRRGMIDGEFHSLLDPEMPVPSFISSLTGITNDMLSDAPLFREIADEFLHFIGNSILVAHNAPFDMHFLNHEIRQTYGEYRVANPCLCTVHLSRKLLPQIRNHKLKTVAEHFEVPLINHHRALCDARATAEIFVNLLAALESAGMSDLAAIKRLGLRRGAYVG